VTTSHVRAPVAAPAADRAGATPAPGGYRSVRPADRWMRRILGVRGVDLRSGARAHQSFRISVVVSAVRCIVTYVAVPVLLPVLSLSGSVAAPIGLALCAVAAVSGMISLRRFWRADHSHRWTYTAFITIVFAILTVATITELNRIGAVL
jgi:predicted permease